MIRVILKGDGVLKGDGNHVGRQLEMRWLKGDQPHLIWILGGSVRFDKKNSHNARRAGTAPTA